MTLLAILMHFNKLSFEMNLSAIVSNFSLNVSASDFRRLQASLQT